MLRDVDDYPNPEEFRPERYLIDHDGVLVRNKTVRDPLSFAFGFGRRCARKPPVDVPHNCSSIHALGFAPVAMLPNRPSSPW